MSQFKELRGSLPVGITVPYVPAAGVGGSSWVAPNNMVIVSASLLWGASITGAATNNFVISFFNRTSGAGTVQWATAITYASGTNATKATAVTPTLSSTATDLQIASGDCISIEITTNGTGLICPGGTVMLALRNR